MIWQRDANSYALRSLEFCDSPPRAVERHRHRNAFGAPWRTGSPSALESPAISSGSEGAAALLNDASACYRLMGPPTVSDEQLMEMAASWIEAGGTSLDKPTHFEISDGKF